MWEASAQLDRFPTQKHDHFLKKKNKEGKKEEEEEEEEEDASVYCCKFKVHIFNYFEI